jgi:hypothetical protein
MSFWKKIAAFFSSSDNPEEAVSIFVDATKSEDTRRAQIGMIEALSDKLGSSSDPNAKTGARIAYSKLVSALGDPAPWVLATALKGLRELAGCFRYEIDAAVIRQSVGAALGLVGHPDADVRMAAASLLSGIVDVLEPVEKPAVVDAIARLLEDPAKEVQASGCFGLAACGDAARGYWFHLAAKLASGDERVRANAASGLWMVGHETPDSAIVETLAGMVGSDPSTRVRADVANALGKLGKGSTHAQRALMSALDDGASDVRHFAIFALSDWGEDAAGAVPKLASLAAGEHREGVAIALRAIGTPTAQQALVAAGLPIEA